MLKTGNENAIKSLQKELSVTTMPEQFSAETKEAAEDDLAVEAWRRIHSAV